MRNVKGMGWIVLGQFLLHKNAVASVLPPGCCGGASTLATKKRTIVLKIRTGCTVWVIKHASDLQVIYRSQWRMAENSAQRGAMSSA